MPQLYTDPQQAKEHQEGNLVMIITVVNALSTSNDPGSVLGPLSVLSPIVLPTTM